MSNRIRQTLVAVAFAATAAAGITGATLRGETRETDLAAACAAAAWPMIPAECLEGEDGQDVRFVTADDLRSANSEVRTASNDTVAERFAVAFQ